MPRTGELVPRPLLNYRCNYAIEASNVGEQYLPVLVEVIEDNMLGMGKVAGKGSTNHPDFPQTVFVEIDQDRLDVFKLIEASKVFTRQLNMQDPSQDTFNHLLTVVAEAQIDSVLPRPFANVQGVDQQIDFELEYTNESTQRVNNAMLSVMNRDYIIKDFNIAGNSDTGRVTVSGTTGQSIVSVNNLVDMLEQLEQEGVVAESFNITCTVTELVRV